MIRLWNLQSKLALINTHKYVANRQTNEQMNNSSAQLLNCFDIVKVQTDRQIDEWTKVTLEVLCD